MGWGQYSSHCDLIFFFFVCFFYLNRFLLFSFYCSFAVSFLYSRKFPLKQGVSAYKMVCSSLLHRSEACFLLSLWLRSVPKKITSVAKTHINIIKKKQKRKSSINRDASYFAYYCSELPSLFDHVCKFLSKNKMLAIMTDSLRQSFLFLQINSNTHKVYCSFLILFLQTLTRSNEK